MSATPAAPDRDGGDSVDTEVAALARSRSASGVDGVGDIAGSVSLKLLVTNTQAGTLIGKSGADVRSLQTETAVRIKIASADDNFPGTTDRVVLLTGTPPAVRTAVDTILERLFGVRSRLRPSAPSLPPRALCVPCGFGGSARV